LISSVQPSTDVELRVEINNSFSPAGLISKQPASQDSANFPGFRPKAVWRVKCKSLGGEAKVEPATKLLQSSFDSELRTVISSERGFATKPCLSIAEWRLVRIAKPVRKQQRNNV
jgi:hypothetical protein